MNLSKKLSVLVVVLVVAIVAIGFKILSHGGLLSVELPKPLVIEANQSATPTTEPGSVLGETESSNYTNPLNDIYVNPFAK